MKARSLIRFGAPLAAVSLILTACGGSSGSGDPLKAGSGADKGTIVVGSQTFPESILLGEVYAQALEGAGFKVQRQPNIGAREVLYGQVKSCDIDVTPEYNGALLAYLQAGKGDTAGGQTPHTTDEVNAALKTALDSGLEVLHSAPAQDNNAVVVTQETARADRLKAIPDLAAKAGQMVFGGPPEFKTRQDGIVGMSQQYGVKFKDYRVLDYSGPITVSALKNGDVQAALLFSTSPEIDQSGFVVLDDPKSVLGVNNVTPLICSKAVDDGARKVLNQVSAALTTEELTAMNRGYVLDKKDAADVAGQWLSQNDIKAGSK